MAATRKAYQQWETDNNEKIKPKQMILPELEFTEEQLWWISYGRTWCAVYQDGIFDPTIWTRTDSPPSARVMGVVQNFQEFAHAFECPINSAMNPENKCGIWHS